MTDRRGIIRSSVVVGTPGAIDSAPYDVSARREAPQAYLEERNRFSGTLATGQRLPRRSIGQKANFPSSAADGRMPWQAAYLSEILAKLDSWPWPQACPPALDELSDGARAAGRVSWTIGRNVEQRALEDVLPLQSLGDSEKAENNSV